MLFVTLAYIGIIVFSMEPLTRVLSLNCHGFNIGIEQYLNRLAVNIDVMLLQETWLSDYNSRQLDMISNDFIVFHICFEFS